MAISPELPTHAYVLGFSERHPEGHFDHIRNSVRADMSPETLAASDAFQCGLHYLETGYFWEAHEVLEPIWMVLPIDCDERQLVQALIQFANAQLKLEMRRPKAAQRLCGIVRDLLSEVGAEVVMGLEISEILLQVDSFEKAKNCAL
jgi:hypothetical protein